MSLVAGGEAKHHSHTTMPIETNITKKLCCVRHVGLDSAFSLCARQVGLDSVMKHAGYTAFLCGQRQFCMQHIHNRL